MRPFHVQGLYERLAKDGYSADAAKKAGQVLGFACKYAVKMGWAASNPVAVIRKPRVCKPEMVIFNEDQMRLYLSQLEGERLYALFLLALTSGMRWAEMVGLRWLDVDWTASRVTVNRQIREVSGTFHERPPKTAASRRTLSIPDVTLAALRQRQEQAAREGLGDCPLIFPDVDGGPLRNSNVRRRVHLAACKRAGVPEIRLHDLRHTHASHLLAKGVPVKVVSERLGHSTISITLDTYAHVLPNMQDAAIATLNAFGTTLEPQTALSGGSEFPKSLV